MARKVAERERQSAAALLVPLLIERQRRIAAAIYTPANDLHLRQLCSILLWKYSEAAGKYRGCRFWTLGALKSRKKHGRVVTSKLRFGADALRHEHLFPRQQQIAKLFEMAVPSPERVRARLDQLNIGVVVTEAEHAKLSKRGDEENPWDRYRNARVKVKCEDPEHDA